MEDKGIKGVCIAVWHKLTNYLSLYHKDVMMVHYQCWRQTLVSVMMVEGEKTQVLILQYGRHVKFGPTNQKYMSKLFKIPDHITSRVIIYINTQIVGYNNVTL